MLKYFYYSSMQVSKILDKNNVDVVIYHHPCSDGFGSAFVVWYYYKINFGMDRTSKIIFMPSTHLAKGDTLSTEYLDKLKGKNILMCDFSYAYSELSKIIDVAKSFLILDHHKTAKADLNAVPDDLKIFDMERSGAGITWDYFFTNKAIPRFLALIQDRDIWSKKYPETDEFVTFFYDLEFDFNLWETYLNPENVETAIQKGKAFQEYQHRLITKIINRVAYVIHEIDGKYIIGLYSNCPELQSDIGNKVFDKLTFGDFSAIWHYDLYKNRTLYSLRSTNDRHDVSVVAKKFGGGGHRNASGVSFESCVPTLPLPVIDDMGIFRLLLNCTTGTIKINNREIGYTLFKSNEIKEQWLTQKYLELLKRKTAKTPYIVFETPSESIDFSHTDSQIIPLRDYTLIYNEISIEKPEQKLQFMINGNTDQTIVFSSKKEFHELFIDNDNNSDKYSQESDSEISEDE